MEKGHNLFLVKTYFFTTKTVPAQKKNCFMHIYIKSSHVASIGNLVRKDHNFDVRVKSSFLKEGEGEKQK